MQIRQCKIMAVLNAFYRQRHGNAFPAYRSHPKDRGTKSVGYDMKRMHCLTNNLTRSIPSQRLFGAAGRSRMTLRVFLSKIERMGPIHELGEIVGEASRFELPHQRCHPRSIFFAEDQHWIVMRDQQCGVELGVR